MMSSTPPLTYDQIIQRFADWAEHRDDIRAAIIIGSQARSDHPADIWSDLDIVMMCADPAKYVADGSWVEAFGPVWCTFLEQQAVAEGMERRVLYEGCLDVDFALLPAAAMREMAKNHLPPQIVAVLLRGYRFIVDKDNLSELIDPGSLSVPATPLPTEQEFTNLCTDYWYHTVWTTKKIRRGEIWTAQWCLNNHMGWRLLLMLEWHSRAVNGQKPWHNGRFLEQWADPRAVRALQGTFAHFDAADVQRALSAQMDLFRWVAKETAEALRYTYPASADDQCSRWVKTSL